MRHNPCAEGWFPADTGASPPWMVRGPSAPAESRRDEFEDRLDHMRVVGDAELVGHGEKQRIGLGDGFVLTQLLHQDVWLGGIGAAEDGAPLRLDVAEMILAFAAAEIGAVAVIDQREDAAADRDARLACVCLLYTSPSPRD